MFDGIAEGFATARARIEKAVQQGAAYVDRVASVAEECINELDRAESIEDVQRIVERAGKRVADIPVVEKTAGDKVLGVLTGFKDGVVKLFSSAATGFANLFRSKGSKQALVAELRQNLEKAKEEAKRGMQGIRDEFSSRGTTEVEPVQRDAPKVKVKVYSPAYIAAVERQKARVAEQEAKKGVHPPTSVGWPATGSTTKASKVASQPVPVEKQTVEEKRAELRRKW